MSIRTLPSADPVLVSMGDACGIGPEIIAKSFLSCDWGGAVVVGQVAILRRALRQVGAAWPVARLDRPADVVNLPAGVLPVWEPEGLPPGLIDEPQGQVSAMAGAAAALCIQAGVAEQLSGRSRGLVTAPIHKEALHAAGVPYPGHTEMLQAQASAHVGRDLPVRMMLANDELRVVLVTIHVSLRRAIDLLSVPAILETLRITDEAGRRAGMPRPRIAVAGLNPHAGEGGLFGDEELTLIGPAIRMAQAEGMDVRGPFAPDTVFMRARDAVGHVGEFDFVVAMTHDHGLIPVKYLGVEQGVNVTLGLPLVRTSPDHGTAFDLAGTGRADEASLRAALRMARRMAPGT